MTLRTELADQCEHVQRQLDDAVELINWMARTYNDNDPIFMFHDYYGQALPQATRLFRTWQRVVRHKSENEIDVMLSHLSDTTPIAQLPLDEASDPRETPEGHQQGE